MLPSNPHPHSFPNQVYRGVYKGMDVAVKVIHASLMQSMDRRKVYQDTFIDEATLMMRLKHPNLQTMEGT